MLPGSPAPSPAAFVVESRPLVSPVRPPPSPAFVVESPSSLLSCCCCPDSDSDSEGACSSPGTWLGGESAFVSEVGDSSFEGVASVAGLEPSRPESGSMEEAVCRDAEVFLSIGVAPMEAMNLSRRSRSSRSRCSIARSSLPLLSAVFLHLPQVLGSQREQTRPCLRQAQLDRAEQV